MSGVSFIQITDHHLLETEETLGKSKDTPLERAADDYVSLFKQVYRHADYVAINISSPKTLNLRQLQARDYIEGLLKEVTAARDELAATSSRVIASASQRSNPVFGAEIASLHSSTRRQNNAAPLRTLLAMTAVQPADTRLDAKVILPQTVDRSPGNDRSRPGSADGSVSRAGC